jgi:hypothetical protein
MHSHRSVLWLALLGCGLLLGVGCGPSATVQGRVTDAQGNPLAGVEVSAVQVASSDPAHASVFMVAKGSTRSKGSFDLRAALGRLRILVRAQVGPTVYLPTLGPDFELSKPGMALAGMDLALTATRPSSLTVAISATAKASASLMEDAALVLPLAVK